MLINVSTINNIEIGDNMDKVLKVILIIAGFFVGFSFLVLGIAFFALADAVSPTTQDEETSTISGARVALVELKGVITSSEEVIKQLKKYQKNKNVKSIVVRVESPGGVVAPSQEIYEAIKNVRESGKPIVISMGSVAASGGYYVSVGATKIFANPGTLTGSIGVILQVDNVVGLMDKIGVNVTTVKSGQLKDAGSPYRKFNDEDRKYFQNLIDNSYDQFVGTVANERKIELGKLKQIADGRVFTGLQAYEYGLVDSLGTYEDAIKYAAMLGGIEGEPKTVKEKKKQTVMEMMMGENPSNKIYDMMFNSPSLQYKLSFD
jgi:protease-4